MRITLLFELLRLDGALGLNCSSSIMEITFSLVAGFTVSLLFRILETVAMETLAFCAISSIVIFEFCVITNPPFKFFYFTKYS